MRHGSNLRTLFAQGIASIIAWLVNTCWFFFKWGILLVLIAALTIGGYFYLRMDDEIRRYAECLLADHYSDLDVRVGGARFEAGQGVTLRHLLLSKRGPQGELRPLVEIEEIELHGNFDVESLIAGKPEIQQIVLRQAHLHAVRSASGHWNLSVLGPPPSAGERPAAIKIVDASVTLTDSGNPIAEPLVVRGIRLDVTSDSSNIATQPGERPERLYKITGAIDGPHAESFLFQGQFNSVGGAFGVEAQINQLAISPELLRSLPGIDPALLEWGQLSGKANLQLTAERLGQTDAPVTWKTNFQISEGHAVIEGLPRQIRDLSVEGSASDQRLAIREARARVGKTRLVLACDRYGWTRAAPLALQARAIDLTIDESLREIFPPAIEKIWQRFRPVGQVKASIVLRYNGQKWQPDITIDCLDVALEDREKFPYRVDHGRGRVRFFDLGDGSGGQLHVDLQAEAGDRPVTITGRLTGMASLGEPPRPQPPGWFEIQGENLWISDDLLNALPSKSAQVVRSFDPHGRFSVRWRSERMVAGGKPQTETDLTFHDGQVRYDKFPYTLTHINGRLQERSGVWKFENLVSRDPEGNREIRCHGTSEPTANGRQLSLLFTGTEVALDDSLRLALPKDFQKTWAALRPIGRVGFRADIRHQVGDKKPSILLDVNPLRQTVSVEPTFFRYRLDKLDGSISMNDGKVTMKNLRASHGQTTMMTDATWVRTPQGGWQFDLSNLHVDRLTANYDFVLASPLGLRKVIEAIKPKGSFSIHHGDLRFTRDRAGSTHLRSEWNFQLGCQQNDLELGVPLDNVSGVIQLAGRHEGNSSFTVGQLDIDSAFWKGIQFTNLRGPLWVDNDECRLGRGATDKINQIQNRKNPREPIEANLYGGQFSLDANVQLESAGRYTVAVQLDKADLQRMSTEYLGGTTGLTGTLTGKGTLTGMGRSPDLMEGGGQFAIRDASMYELPVMARMLKVLRNRVPDKTAFNGVDAQFRLDGNKVVFDELNLLGDAVSLYGKGSISFDKQLDLAFHTSVGRNDLNLPVLRSMIGQASANLLLIKVTGAADNPEVRREALPVVNDFVEQITDGPLASPPHKLSDFWRR